MAFQISISKTRVQELIECIEKGLPIRPGDSRGWSVADQLAIAAAFKWAASESLGASREKLRPREVTQPPFEHLEAEISLVDKEVDLAMEFLRHIVFSVDFGKYDQQFDDQIVATVYTDGEKQRIRAIRGIRKPVE